MSVMKREPKANKYGIEFEGDIELSPELDTKVTKMIEQADAEIEAARVNFRWDKQHVDLIKTAAELLGVPYQVYIKMVLAEHAVNTVQRFAGIINPGQRPIVAPPTGIISTRRPTL